LLLCRVSRRINLFRRFSNNNIIVFASILHNIPCERRTVPRPKSSRRGFPQSRYHALPDGVFAHYRRKTSARPLGTGLGSRRLLPGKNPPTIPFNGCKIKKTAIMVIIVMHTGRLYYAVAFVRPNDNYTHDVIFVKSSDRLCTIAENCRQTRNQALLVNIRLDINLNDHVHATNVNTLSRTRVGLRYLYIVQCYFRMNGGKQKLTYWRIIAGYRLRRYIIRTCNNNIIRTSCRSF